MSAVEQLYLDHCGHRGTPPRWDEDTNAQGARGMSQSCALVAHRASEAGADARATRWGLSAILWRHRADYLDGQAADLGWLTGRHRRALLATRSRAAAVARFQHEDRNV